MNEVSHLIIADDHQLVRDGLRLILSANPAWTIIAEAGDGAALLGLLESNPCDLVITDLNMPGMKGIQLVRTLKMRHPAIPVLVLTMHNEQEIIQEILLAEAEGYLLKNAGKNEVAEAVSDLLNGKTHYDKQIMQTLLQEFRLQKRQEQAIKPLSPRELEILKWIIAEKNSREIAEMLFISKQTVDTHRASIMEKTGSHTLVGLIKYAIRNGLDSPSL